MAFSKQTQIIGLIVWLAISYSAAAIGGAASVKAAPFYTELTRPEWAPPSSLFGPVWTLLYTLMGIAAWLVWRDKGFQAARTALILFFVQLAVNAIWSWFFFAWRMGALSFLDIILLWALLVATVIKFWRISPLAGGLLIPYLAWVSYAAALNYSVWKLNPQIL